MLDEAQPDRSGAKQRTIRHPPNRAMNRFVSPDMVHGPSSFLEKDVEPVR